MQAKTEKKQKLLNLKKHITKAQQLLWRAIVWPQQVTSIGVEWRTTTHLESSLTVITTTINKNTHTTLTFQQFQTGAATGTYVAHLVLGVVLGAARRCVAAACNTQRHIYHHPQPRHRRTNFGRRAFTVAGPTAWNSLPDYLCDASLSEDTFRRLLKTYLFALY